MALDTSCAMSVAHSDSCLPQRSKISLLPVPGVRVKTPSICSELHLSKSQSLRQSRGGSVATPTIPEFLTTSYPSPTVDITSANLGVVQAHSQTFGFGPSRPPSETFHREGVWGRWVRLDKDSNRRQEPKLNRLTTDSTNPSFSRQIHRRSKYL